MADRPSSLRRPAGSSDKRPMGAGSIEERNGRHRARLRIGGKRVELGTYDSHDEAAGVLQAALDKLAAGGTTSGAITLRDWVERWLEVRELSGAVRSIDDDRSRLRAHVLAEPWADDPLDAISTRQLRAWVHSLVLRRVRRHDGRGGLRELERTLSRHTIAHIFATLRVCLRDAVEAGHIDENPAHGVRLPKAQYTREPWTYLTQAEIESLLQCAEIPEPYRLLFAVAVYTGLRKGELWGLRWGDVYLDHATPHLMVRRSRTEAPKNGKIRLVPLLAPARAALDRLQKLRTPKQRDDVQSLVFPTRAGGMRSKWDDARWAEHRQLAGIVRAARFHDLRHTCASHLLMGTWGRAWRLEEVRDFLGHSDVTVTQRYAHLSPDRLHAAAAATVPTPAPGSAPSSARASAKAADLPAESGRSHLRDLNPRPTVYETAGDLSLGAGLGAPGAGVGPAKLQGLAIAMLVQAARGAVLREDAERLAAAVLELPLPAAARAIDGARHDQLGVRAVALAELVLGALAATTDAEEAV
ncbi:MAG TPA: tyrosine-type recombinase/integrase [Polyangiales bacterium]|jgi:integrase|nr:tyrosine-type recombinase/integrase [Polyangiales bacterium]